MTWMLKNSRGRRDALLTLAVATTVAVLTKVLLNGASMTIAGTTIAFGTIDSALAGVVLGATVGAYTWKRVKGAKDEPGSLPPAAGLIDWRLAVALLVALGLIGLGIWDPWGWGLVDAGLLLSAGCVVGAWFTSRESPNGWCLGEEWGPAEVLALVGAFLFLASLVGALVLVPWWADAIFALVSGGWAAWAKRAWLADRARAAWARVLGLFRRKG